MMNIGFNPTFNSQKKSIEIHILDFNLDIYGEDLKVSVVKKIRKEKKFSSVEELKKILKLDENKVRQLLKIKKNYHRSFLLKINLKNLLQTTANHY